MRSKLHQATDLAFGATKQMAHTLVISWLHGLPWKGNLTEIKERNISDKHGRNCMLKQVQDANPQVYCVADHIRGLVCDNNPKGFLSSHRYLARPQETLQVCFQG